MGLRLVLVSIESSVWNEEGSTPVGHHHAHDIGEISADAAVGHREWSLV